MGNKDYYDVIVKEAYYEDAGRGIARLSIDAMKALQLVSGDVIEIQGKKLAFAVVWPSGSEDTRKSILRIDGSLRSNIGSGIDDRVRIRKADISYARKVVIQPTEAIRLGVANNFSDVNSMGGQFRKGNNSELLFLVTLSHS
jgi:transitional endoplasmic reticulum ATPase